MTLKIKNLHSALLDSLEQPIAVLDRHGNILCVNQSWINFGVENGMDRDYYLKITNYLEVCENASQCGKDHDAVAVQAGIREVIANHKHSFSYEYPCHSPCQQRWYMMRITPIVTEPDYFLVTHQQITGRRLAEQRIEKQNLELQKLLKIASIDKLTQLANRTAIDESLDKEINRAKRYDFRFCLIIADIDHFKKINDDYGHQIGDQVLMEIAKIIKENVRSCDFVGRWGGEEFVLLCPGINAKKACAMAEKIRALISQSHILGREAVNCSFGVAQYRANQSSFELIQAADSALYQAKSKGRNRVEMAKTHVSKFLKAVTLKSSDPKL